LEDLASNFEWYIAETSLPSPLLSEQPTVKLGPFITDEERRTVLASIKELSRISHGNLELHKGLLVAGRDDDYILQHGGSLFSFALEELPVNTTFTRIPGITAMPITSFTRTETARIFREIRDCIRDPAFLPPSFGVKTTPCAEAVLDLWNTWWLPDIPSASTRNPSRTSHVRFIIAHLSKTWVAYPLYHMLWPGWNRGAGSRRCRIAEASMHVTFGSFSVAEN
jgi:hypothetical protein